MSELAAAAGASSPPRSPPLEPCADENEAARRFAQAVSEDELWQRSEQRLPYGHFAYPTDRPLVWVKFGEPWRLAEADMQRLAWQWLRSQRETKQCSPDIHVPEVFRTFTRGPRAFIIMELVDGTVLAKSVFAKPMGSLHPVEQCFDLIAEGIQVLRQMPVPPDATPGPYTAEYGHRIIRHPIFKDQAARFVYRDVDQLERHLNKVIACRFPRGEAPTLHLERQLVFSYCDLNDENFMFKRDANGRLRLYIVDFEHASFLPLCFLAYAVLRHSQWWSQPPIAERIGATFPDTNLDLLGHADYVFKVFVWTSTASTLHRSA
ncbi:uncharacterized protein THITE_2087957 [Thermothielavioides terrestris NRRL 8126]|uniref:Aminoglycoside phosphotransferase domain-containing protein n=1 Tax=Thermothielavioides terrestris (strain ATCC 38088 / NRRL 8126) TaxID=578455 RepID=G2R0L3_THETT|nr:uncharacterized protein THITE_2087957 [Thermothielavioides terrestris NRRL 8126]AEO66481.1 hypothetical protein THITE_2087957 [Thermothielavioides terrestris NRRL 8126]